MTRKRVITCVLLNLVATPGLGSLLAQRRLEGGGQIALSLAGFILLILWFFAVMKNYYGQMFGGDPTTHPTVGLTGLVLGAELFALGWIWSLVTSLSLLHAAKQEKISELKAFGAATVKLDEGKILSALADLPAWTRGGQIISRTFQFQDFPAALKFVNAVAEIAEAAQHHPDIDVRWNKVTLAFTTHDVGGLTEKDFILAHQCAALAAPS